MALYTAVSAAGAESVVSRRRPIFGRCSTQCDTRRDWRGLADAAERFSAMAGGLGGLAFLPFKTTHDVAMILRASTKAGGRHRLAVVDNRSIKVPAEERRAPHM